VPNSLLPLQVVRRVKLSLGDCEILQQASREMKCSQADIIRFAIRRLGLVPSASPLTAQTVAALRQTCHGLALGPGVAPTVEPPSGKLVDAV